MGMIVQKQEKPMARQYDPDKYHRRSIRLRGWDYTTPGAYFITICTYQRENLFEDDRFRELAENAWRNIPTHPHASRVILDEWIVMPNHLHGILILTDPETNDNEARRDEAQIDVSKTNQISLQAASSPPADTLFPASSLPFDSLPSSYPPHGVESGSIGAIVGNFKSLVTRRVNNLRRTPGAKFWQRGYYDRIVRNERELNAIRQYVWDNPRRWEEDRENLDALLARMRLVVS
jgi:putative transposase